MIRARTYQSSSDSMLVDPSPELQVFAIERHHQELSKWNLRSLISQK